MALPKKLRLTSAKSISKVFSESRPIHEAGISLRVAIGEKDKSVVAVLVPASAVPRAVQRNTLKRRVTEALRHLIASGRIASGKRIVVTVRSLPRDAKTLEEILVLLLRKSAILQK